MTAYGPCRWCGLVKRDKRHVFPWDPGYDAANPGSAPHTFEPVACCVGTPVPHTASARCESGKRDHCTCDTCF